MPIPKMTLTEILITEQTCGDACWHAKEDVCHCSCGGKNHGCLRTEDGEQPTRTRKIKNNMYQLVVVEPIKENACIAETTQPIYKLERTIDDNAIKAGLFEYYELKGCKSFCQKPLPVYVKSASDSEIKRWPELSQWRNKTELELIIHKPLTVWVRIDLLNLVPDQK
jgi:hypothetical protein